MGIVIQNYVEFALMRELRAMYNSIEVHKGIKAIRKLCRKDPSVNETVLHLFKVKLFAEHVEGELSREYLENTLMDKMNLRFAIQNTRRAKTNSLKKFINKKLDTIIDCCFAVPSKPHSCSA